MADISSVERSPEIEDVGREMELTTLPGAYVTVRGPSYPPFERTVSRKLARLPRKDRDTAWLAVRREAAADELLLGWREMTMNGQPIAVTPENKRMLLCDRRFVDISNGIMLAVDSVGYVDAENQKADEGN